MAGAVHTPRRAGVRFAAGVFALALAGAVAATAFGGGETAPGVSQTQSEPPRPPTAAEVTPEPPRSALVEVSVTAPEKTVLEGSVGTFRVRRNATEGGLRVRLRLAGTATLEQDYRLDGFAELSGDTVHIGFVPGQTSAVLAVDVDDDIAAEAVERVAVTLLPDAAYAVAADAGGAQLTIAQNDTVVTTTADSGEGSLRQAILNANNLPGPHTISFDTETGPFAEPQTIVLARPLPALTGEFTLHGYIEGRLWKPSGVTLSGDNAHPVFHVASGGRVTLRGFTIAEGRAEIGAGLVNEGEVVVSGVTFVDNEAAQQGGALANSGGKLTLINSTFTGNGAGVAGGGLANLGGAATVTNCTFSENAAPRGAGLFNEGKLLLRNTILANSEGGEDCESTGDWDGAGTHNLIETHTGCGTPISSADPRLGNFGGYNGPTPTFPLGGGSPAINLGDNGSALDENGAPLVWDQRGNGDPRFVGGITDIGAFEHQKLPTLLVDIPEDSVLRACTLAGEADCSLRGAITLANAMGKPAHIRFDPAAFGEAQALRLGSPLPPIRVEVTIDASNNGGLNIATEGAFPVFRFKPEPVDED